MTSTARANCSGWLLRLGIDRPEPRAWALYDWANSAFVTTIVAAVFPVYFSSVAAADLPPAVATARFALATTTALALDALLAPFLGALADSAALKKRLLAGFMGLGVLATGAMVFVGRGEWLLAAILFGLGNVGASGSFVFYDSLLPHVARGGAEMDRVSTTGYALGYLGGAVLLAVNLAWIAHPQLFGLADAAAAARLSFFSVALWWLLFSLPLFRRVAEPPLRRDAARRRLRETFGELRGYKQAFVFLLGFLLYNDGIGTIIRMAVIYGAEVGIPQGSLIAAILLVQCIGVPFAVLFGSIAARIGAKRAIFTALAVYVAISIIGYFMRTAWHFYLLAALVGTVQGGSQALSRSLFARMIPRSRSAQFFGFFSVCEKFAGIFGPALFAAAVALTGSSRNAILSIIAFFIAGGLLVASVDVAEGERAARAADAEAGA